MKLPFTNDQFLEVFRTYNLAVWPFQVIFYILAAVILYLALWRPTGGKKTIALTLSFFWFWMGMVYHLAFFSSVNKAAYLFGGLFIIEGIFFLYYGIYKNRLAFRFRADLSGIYGLSFILFGLLIYPAIGYFQGHVFPFTPTFGLPCPTTIFTFGLLLWTDRKMPKIILIIPLLWAAIGTTAAFMLGMYADAALLVAGVITVLLVVFRKK